MLLFVWKCFLSGRMTLDGAEETHTTASHSTSQVPGLNVPPGDLKSLLPLSLPVQRVWIQGCQQIDKRPHQRFFCLGKVQKSYRRYFQSSLVARQVRELAWLPLPWLGLEPWPRERSWAAGPQKGASLGGKLGATVRPLLTVALRVLFHLWPRTLSVCALHPGPCAEGTFLGRDRYQRPHSYGSVNS